MIELARPWILSLQIASGATLLALAIGLPLAYLLARRQFWGRSLLEGLLMLPLVLPPTVVGFLLLYVLGRNGAVGWLTQGASLLFTRTGALVACTAVILPLVILPAKAGFAAIRRELVEEAQLMGASRLQMLMYVAIPLAFRGILSGAMLGFGRALGEFGATLMVVGTGENVRTLPVQIYIDTAVSNDLSAAWPAVLVLGTTSLALTIMLNRFRLLDFK